MIKVKTRTYLNCALLVPALFAAGNVNAETFAFSYTFAGTDDRQIYAPGSKLTGQIDGTVDPTDPTGNSVIINSFGAVSLSRVGAERFDYPSVESDEFNTWHAGLTPRASFDGSNINFRACPGGFTHPEEIGVPKEDCPFSTATGGGFLVATENPSGIRSFAAAADGTGTGSGLYVVDVNATQGGRVTDKGDIESPGTLAGSWSLVVLPDNANIDSTVVIGSDSTIENNVEIDEGVVLGENVFVDKNTSIGADSTISGDVILSKNVDIGSDVMIGSDGVAEHNVLIENGVTIGDSTTIDHGVHICAGATIGSFVAIGQNNLILNGPGVDVPVGIVLNGLEDRPGECP